MGSHPFLLGKTPFSSAPGPPPPFGLGTGSEGGPPFFFFGCQALFCLSPPPPSPSHATATKTVSPPFSNSLFFRQKGFPPFVPSRPPFARGLPPLEGAGISFFPVFNGVLSPAFPRVWRGRFGRYRNTFVKSGALFFFSGRPGICSRFLGDHLWVQG